MDGRERKKAALSTLNKIHRHVCPLVAGLIGLIVVYATKTQ